MAITRIGSTSGNAINSGSITLTLPGSMAVNDLILIAFGVGDDDFTQPTLAMTTSGYTELTSSTLSSDGGTAGDGNLAVFYKFHNGSDTTAVTTAAGAGTDSSTAAALIVFRGVSTVAQGGPLEIAIATASGTSGGDPNPPSVSGFTEALSAVVIAGACGNTGALTLTAPTNYTTNAVNAIGDDTFDTSVGLAYRLSGASDPEDPGVFADNGAGAAWCAATMVLKAINLVSVTPTTAALVTTKFAPTVTVSDNKIVTPTTAALVTTKFAPTVSVTNNILVTPTTKALVTTTFAPTVTVADPSPEVIPDVATLTITTFAPTVSIITNSSINLEVGSYSIIGVPSLNQFTLGVLAGSYSTSGTDAALTRIPANTFTLNVDSGVYTLGGTDAGLTQGAAGGAEPLHLLAIMGMGG